MIRRIIGSECLLFTQVDHARLAGEFAGYVGNAQFAAPQPPVIRATVMHDDGWPLHDDSPTINPQRQPTDVFESQPATAFQIWAESSRLAASADPYVGLLVSLHGFALSIYASRNSGHVNMDDPIIRFELNKFQHAQIELQETLRHELGMATNIALCAGLAQDSDDPREQKLVFDLRILQAMDTLSLCLLCTAAPFEKIRLRQRPDRPAVECTVRRTGDFQIAVDPWPFNPAEVRAPVQYRTMAQTVYESDEALREDYAAAPIQRVEVSIIPESP